MKKQNYNKTPLTDSQSFDTYLKDGRMRNDRVVSSSFARELERELLSLKELNNIGNLIEAIMDKNFLEIRIFRGTTDKSVLIECDHFNNLIPNGKKIRWAGSSIHSCLEYILNYIKNEEAFI